MNANGEMCGTRKRAKSYDYQLDGLVFCGLCNRHMTTSIARGRSDRYPYYRCVGDVRMKDCDAKSVNAAELDRWTLGKMIEYCEDPTEIEEALKADRKDTEAGLGLLTGQLALAQKEHAAVKRTMENLLAVAGSGKISSDNLSVFDEEIKKQRGILAHNEERVNALAAEIAHQKNRPRGSRCVSSLPPWPSTCVTVHLKNAEVGSAPA